MLQTPFSVTIAEDMLKNRHKEKNDDLEDAKNSQHSEVTEIFFNRRTPTVYLLYLFNTVY